MQKYCRPIIILTEAMLALYRTYRSASSALVLEIPSNPQSFYRVLVHRRITVIGNCSKKVSEKNDIGHLNLCALFHGFHRHETRRHWSRTGRHDISIKYLVLYRYIVKLSNIISFWWLDNFVSIERSLQVDSGNAAL